MKFHVESEMQLILTKSTFRLYHILRAYADRVLSLELPLKCFQVSKTKLCPLGYKISNNKFGITRHTESENFSIVWDTSVK